MSAKTLRERVARALRVPSGPMVAHLAPTLAMEAVREFRAASGLPVPTVSAEQVETLAHHLGIRWERLLALIPEDLGITVTGGGE